MLEELLFNEKGATSVEYVIMASLIAGVIVAAVTFFGINVNGLFQLVVNLYPP